MTILLTGGTGKTSLRLASLFGSASIPILLTSRRGPSASSTHPTVQFDWNIPSTWSNPFSTASDISAVYLLSGELSNPAPILNAFIDFAIEKGVRRFVLCSGSSCEYGGPFHGKIWQKLDESKVEWAVLRPSWFMGMFFLFSFTPTSPPPLLSLYHFISLLLLLSRTTLMISPTHEQKISQNQDTDISKQ
jgi:festuclavine dehydrogenase